MKKSNFTFLMSMLNFKLSFYLEQTTKKKLIFYKTFLSSDGKPIKKILSLVINGTYCK